MIICCVLSERHRNHITVRKKGICHWVFKSYHESWGEGSLSNLVYVDMWGKKHNKSIMTTSFTIMQPTNNLYILFDEDKESLLCHFCKRLWSSIYFHCISRWHQNLSGKCIHKNSTLTERKTAVKGLCWNESYLPLDKDCCKLSYQELDKLASHTFMKICHCSTPCECVWDLWQCG